MSYKDILEAQAKRDTKEAAVVEGKPSRKRKGSTPVAAQAKRTRRSEVEVAEQEIEAEGLGILFGSGSQIPLSGGYAHIRLPVIVVLDHRIQTI
jgi:hypothetical protein